MSLEHPINVASIEDNNTGGKESVLHSPDLPSSTDGLESQERLGDEAPVRNYSTWQWLLVCVAIYSSSFLYGLDNAIVADIQGPLIDDLGEFGKLGWLAVGFPLGSVATILSFGKAYGTFDIKWLYVGSTVMFTAASALCGAAPNMNALIIGRVWAGIGGAGMYLGVLNLVTVSTSLHERPLYMSLNGLVWGVGCVLGPVIGGAFADSPATWRWAFYINLILFAIFAPGLLLVLQPVCLTPNVPFIQRLLSMDWLGMTLNAAMYTVFVMVFTMAGVEWTWNDARTISMLIVLGIILIAFVVTQSFALFTSTSNRLFPGDFLRDKTLVLLYISQACASTALFLPIYYIPLFYQLVHGEGGIQAAVRLIPFMIIAVAACLVQGAVMPRIGYSTPWFFAASVFSVVAGALFYGAIDIDTPTSHVYGFSVLLGLGAGLSQTVAYSRAAGEVPLSRASDAVAFINTAQIGSSVIALTIASSIFQNVGRHRVSEAMQGLGYSAADVGYALQGQRSTILQELPVEVRNRILESISQTIVDEFILVMAAGCLGTIASLLLPWKRSIIDPSTAVAM
ncbi:putative efflux pump antibiotic resistance protein [Corynespora cassiicola Philippines]|uniref:Putative efflux pump antibiotic resistance protein n=1 Tax=Corynespora cassiicola Philippines TaxID=1448308 RepID=A0A2T2N2W9_CORCC|nr:putative efflux pump antibiotic resistance protein [Corynespora cassiicola Philippines]